MILKSKKAFGCRNSHQVRGNENGLHFPMSTQNGGANKIKSNSLFLKINLVRLETVCFLKTVAEMF